MRLYAQDPSANLDYTEDWSEWLDTDTISASAWSITPSGPTLSGSSSTTTTATVFIADVELGAVYTLTNSIETTGGREDSRSLQIIGEAT